MNNYLYSIPTIMINDDKIYLIFDINKNLKYKYKYLNKNKSYIDLKCD